MPAETATFAEFAAILGCRRSYVTALRKAGRLVLTDSGRVDVEASRERIAATRDPAKAGVAARHAAARGASLATVAAPADDAPAAADAADGHDDSQVTSIGYQHWKERSERAKALAGERENAIAEGKLMDAGAVERAIADAVTGLRARLETLPDILGPQLAAIGDEARIRALLAGEIEHALDECHRKFAAIGKADHA